MKWLSFINGIAGILLILVGVSGMIGNRLAAAGVAILGLIVLVLATLRWITAFERFSGAGHAPLHTA
jgi:hypothetical protein